MSMRVSSIEKSQRKSRRKMRKVKTNLKKKNNYPNTLTDLSCYQADITILEEIDPDCWSL